MNWAPIAIRQQNRDGLNEPTPEVLSACWATQTVGLVFPAVGGLQSVWLLLTTPDDGLTRQVAVTVDLCEVTPGVPSDWRPIDSQTLRMSDLESGESLAFGLPILALMSAGEWGVRLTSLEYRADNLKIVRDSAMVELTFDEPIEPGDPVGGPFADILNSIGATADDRISVMVHTADSDQRRILLDVANDSWTALVVDEGRPLVVYQGEV